MVNYLTLYDVLFTIMAVPKEVKMSIRLRLSLPFLVFFSLILVACGGSTSPSTTGSVKLTMWTWKIAHIPGLQAIAKDFEARTGINVKVTAYNPDEVYRTKITTAAQSGDLPDILSYWSTSQWDLGAN